MGRGPTMPWAPCAWLGDKAVAMSSIDQEEAVETDSLKIPQAMAALAGKPLCCAARSYPCPEISHSAAPT